MIDTEALRKKVIDLAIQGKLTQQLPEDGNADELYVRIQEEKAKLIKAGKIKREKPLPEISDDEMPFVVPDNWIWVHLGDIASVISKGTTPRGGNVTYLNSGVGFLRVENLAGYNKIDTVSLKYIDESTHNGFLKRSILEAGDVLISIAGTLGKTGLVREEDLPLNTNQAIAFIRIALKYCVDVEYISYILNAVTIQRELGNNKVAMAIPNLSLEVISKAIIPLPPYEEQKRIVIAIKRAFELLDELDFLQQQYESDREILKGKIINAGIRGKLTEQLPEDGDAEDLYAQIQEEKTKLIKEGKIKKEKPSPEISDDEVPFEIPDNWKWVHMGDVFEHNTGKALNNADQNGVKLEYITTSNMYWDHFELDNLKCMFFKESEIEKCTITKGDLLICEGGDIGRSAIWTFDYDMRIQNHIHRLRGYCGIVHKYYYYVMRNYKDMGMIDGRGIGLQGFSSKRVHSLVIPLPPAIEQRKIADIIDEYMRFC